MRFLMLLGILIPLGVAATPAVSQDYWEYAPWEGEWEYHRPTQGLEYEYEDDDYGYYDDYYEEDYYGPYDRDVDVEPEQYEWEPGEGYHEQEWYDPSDWFETGRDLDYEDDDDYGDYYYEDYYYEDYYYDDCCCDSWGWW